MVFMMQTEYGIDFKPVIYELALMHMKYKMIKRVPKYRNFTSSEDMRTNLPKVFLDQ